MAEYKEVIGTAVQTVAGDPDNPVKGQLWYNSTAGEFRYQEQAYGNAWSSGGNMNVARNAMYTAGTQTAALAAGGDSPLTPEFFDGTELYDGSSWTE